MIIILTVVFILMVVMNGALFYVLYSAASTTKKQVSFNFVKELEDYNGYLKGKEQESRQLEEKKEDLDHEISSLEGVILSLKTSPFYAPRPISRELYIPTARYIDNEFFDNHKRVNDMMKQVDQKEIIKNIRERYTYVGNRADYETACRLLEFLDMDTTYQLCTVSSDVQLDTLKEALKGPELEFLSRYLDTLGEDDVFDVLGFRTFIREVRTAQDPKMYIRTGDIKVNKDLQEMIDKDEDLVFKPDANISEGLKIIYQNQSFDFSIYRLRSRK